VFSLHLVNDVGVGMVFYPGVSVSMKSGCTQTFFGRIMNYQASKPEPGPRVQSQTNALLPRWMRLLETYLVVVMDMVNVLLILVLYCVLPIARHFGFAILWGLYFGFNMVSEKKDFQCKIVNPILP